MRICAEPSLAEWRHIVGVEVALRVRKTIAFTTCRFFTADLFDGKMFWTLGAFAGARIGVEFTAGSAYFDVAGLGDVGLVE